MSGSIGAVITGDREAGVRFETFPQEKHEALLARITALTADLAARIDAAVPRKTGKLARQINYKVFDRPEAIIGVAGMRPGLSTADYQKASALEYGSHKSVSVRAHSMRLDHAWGRAMMRPEVVSVPDYARRTNIDALRFLRGAEAAMQSEIESELSAVVNQDVEA